MPSANIERLQNVAEGLGELNEKMVYVGGAVAELYVTDPASTDIRPTKDIDCVTEMDSYGKLGELENLLREKGFQNDRSQGAPICRWVYKGGIVDIMPDDPHVLGFANRWYHAALSSKEKRTLSNGQEIFILSVTYYIATKIEAVKSRGGKDWRFSHDFEDIVYILNYCPAVLEQWNVAATELKQYYADEFTAMLLRPNIREEIECVLPYGEEERAGLVMNIMREMSSLL